MRKKGTKERGEKEKGKKKRVSADLIFLKYLEGPEEKVAKRV